MVLNNGIDILKDHVLLDGDELAINPNAGSQSNLKSENDEHNLTNTSQIINIEHTDGSKMGQVDPKPSQAEASKPPLVSRADSRSDHGYRPSNPGSNQADEDNKSAKNEVQKGN